MLKVDWEQLLASNQLQAIRNEVFKNIRGIDRVDSQNSLQIRAIKNEGLDFK